ncbi:MAG: glycine zipper domain-containing protein [Deltaproteobacteria bacterium]|nr:glycine zipper domain-containing protein [Deltaproteobacteria bacterium]
MLEDIEEINKEILKLKNYDFNYDLSEIINLSTFSFDNLTCAKIMIMRKSVMLVSLVILGCATNQPPLSNREAGALTGAALGAGLGAIVGNQTGDRGAGAVIGGAAGLLGGALVGGALDAQEQRLRDLEERQFEQDRYRYERRRYEDIDRGYERGRYYRDPYTGRQYYDPYDRRGY